MDPDKSRLDKLQRDLYSKQFEKTDSDFDLQEKEYNLKNDWQESKSGEPEVPEKKVLLDELPGPNQDPEKHETSPWFWTLLAGAFVFFLASVFYAGFIFFRDNQVSVGEDVSINIVGPVSVGAGEKLSLDVVIQNNNAVDLELVDLIIEYPEGAKSALDSVTDLKRVRENVGTIASGTAVRKTVSSVLFGEENSTQKINMFIEYRVGSATAIFEKQKEFEILLNASPVRLTIDGLEEISSGQEIELEVKLSSNSNEVLENVLIQASYPFGFIFKEADLPPNLQDNVWYFDRLEPDEEKTFKILGTIEGQNEEERFFRFNVGLSKEDSQFDIGVVFNNASHSTTIKKSFVNLDLDIGNLTNPSGEVVITSGDLIQGVISFTNNTNDVIRNLNISLGISGPALNESSVSVESGFYDSVDNIIFWNTETSNLLTAIRPRDTLNFSFQFRTFDLADGVVSLINPEIRLGAKVTGIRVSDENVEEKIETSLASRVKVVSDIFPVTYTEYNNGPFANTGPIPPKAENETTYTVVLDVSNNSNDLENAIFEAYLPSYVSWNNQYDPSSQNVSYDSQSRKLVWRIGDIPAGTGYQSVSEKLFVSLTARPSLTQVGQEISLLRDLRFSALDSFAGINVVENPDNPTTFLNGQSIADGYQYVVE